MSWLDKLRGRKQETAAPAIADLPPCPHITLVPRWDAAEDIGKNDKATRFICGACGAQFTPEEAREVEATRAERLRATLETDIPASEE